MYKVVSRTYAAIHARTEKFDTIFLYLSFDCNKEDICRILDSWIDHNTPTAIMGDVNVDFSTSSKLIKFLEEKGFQQMIQGATFDAGSLLDHVYVNKPLKKMEISIEQSAAYYTDNDIVTLYIKK